MLSYVLLDSTLYHCHGMMRILKTTRSYVLVFSAYAFYALVTLRNVFRSGNHSLVRPPLWFQIPATLGMAICATALLDLLRKTTNRFEKTAIVLTEAVCVLWLAGVLPWIGLSWAAIPYERYLYAILASASATVVGIRLVQVLRRRETNEEE